VKPSDEINLSLNENDENEINTVSNFNDTNNIKQKSTKKSLVNNSNINPNFNEQIKNYKIPENIEAQKMNLVIK